MMFGGGMGGRRFYTNGVCIQRTLLQHDSTNTPHNTQHTTHAAHVHRRQQQHQNAEPPSRISQLLQILPLILLFAVTMFNFGDSEKAVFR